MHLTVRVLRKVYTTCYAFTDVPKQTDVHEYVLYRCSCLPYIRYLIYVCRIIAIPGYVHYPERCTSEYTRKQLRR